MLSFVLICVLLFVLVLCGLCSSFVLLLVPFLVVVFCRLCSCLCSVCFQTISLNQVLSDRSREAHGGSGRQEPRKDQEERGQGRIRKALVETNQGIRSQGRIHRQ